MNRTLSRALAPLLLFASGEVCAQTSGVPQGIHVSGSGFVEVEPDMGHMQLHVRREGADAAALKQELDSVAGAVLKLASDLGIDRRDVTAAAVSITPRHRRRNDQVMVDGLIATRTIAIKLRDLDQFGELMNRSLAQGINNVDPLRLDTSRREELEDQALKLAMQDALAEAARVASGFSVGLGTVIAVHVTGSGPRPQMARAMMAEAADGAAFSPGLIRVERAVQATFAIDSD